MNVVSRVIFPKTVETAELKIKFDGDSSIDDNKIVFHQGSSISLNTYFNSIYEKFYTKYTTLSSLYYLLKLEGDFEVAVYREDETSKKELIHSQKITECQLSDDVKILLPFQSLGRIYLEITCLSKQGLFTEGLVVTEQQKQTDVSLGIIICTYKKEAFAKNIVKEILQDRLLQDKQFKVFVVDNAKTLSANDFADDRVKLIYNRNFGGSGGFTKGLIEAWQEGVYTHFLFMDDDIELDSEVIYRLFSLYEYAQQDFAVAGSMLDLDKKYVLYEVGSLYNKQVDSQGNFKHRPFILTSVKHNLDLRNPDSLNSLLVEENIDFGGFYFFSFSQAVVEKIGLPLPFFIKIDDLEFSLRIKQYIHNQIVAFPSLAVWHELAYTKKPAWDAYYSFRNQLITNSIHDSMQYLDTVQIFTMGIIYNLMLFNYNTAQMYIKAFEDYMQGPDFIKSNDPETLHTKICAYSKSHKSQSILTNVKLNSEIAVTQVGKLQKILSLLTLNGHLLPQFLIRDQSAIVRYGLQERDSICKGFAKKRVIFVIDNVTQYSQNELDHQAGIYILLSWLKSVFLSSFKWSKVKQEWKQAAQYFTTIDFWQHYLEPHQ